MSIKKRFQKRLPEKQLHSARRPACPLADGFLRLLRFLLLITLFAIAVWQAHSISPLQRATGADCFGTEYSRDARASTSDRFNHNIWVNGDDRVWPADHSDAPRVGLTIRSETVHHYLHVVPVTQWLLPRFITITASFTLDLGKIVFNAWIYTSDGTNPFPVRFRWFPGKR